MSLRERGGTADATDLKSVLSHREAAENKAFPENHPSDFRRTFAEDKPSPRLDPDLAMIVKAWPTLPADVRKMIVGVVKLSRNSR
jgi:hypothetical protein